MTDSWYCEEEEEEEGWQSDSDDETYVPEEKPMQIHHYATNKSTTYTLQFKEIADKYNLNLDDDWNKELLPHQGRHPNAYHAYVLEKMRQYDARANGDRKKFLTLYGGLKAYIRSNPDILYTGP